MEDSDKIVFSEPVEEILIDFGEICRLCLSETKSEITIQEKCSKEESEGINDETICNFVMKMSSIKMESNENFPSLVCENCYELVKVCYNFSQICQRSDHSLRDCYERTLQETKARLCQSENEKTVQENVKINETQIEVSFSECDLNLNTSLNDDQTEMKREEKQVKLKSTSRQKSKDSILVLKADNIKQKYQRINSLTERLKETQCKLSEDIKSNDLSLELPKEDELNKSFNGEKACYGCPQCSLKYNSPEALKFHYAATHGQIKKLKIVNKFKCRKCVRCFGEQENLIRHYKTVHKLEESELLEEDLNHRVRKSLRKCQRKFYCLHCVPYKIFQNRDELLEHLEESHKDDDKEEGKTRKVTKSYGCAHCDSEPRFSSRLTLNRHLRTVHNLKGDEVTWNDVKLIADSDENAAESSDLKLFKVFVCTDCSPPVTFTSANACVQHKVEKHDQQLENIPLEELPAIYVNSPDVFKQGKEEGTQVRLKVICKNCEPPMEFSSASALVSHMFSFHENSNVENWDIETKPINDLPSLDDTNKRESHLWKCSDCPASYFRRQSLFRHSKEKHNKVLNLGTMKCPEPDCTESFSINRQLIQHGISVHKKYFANFHEIFTKKILQPSTEEDNRTKNFECDICQKRYVCKNSLKRHILKTHFGRDPTEKVTCPYCGKMVSNKVNLKSHIEFVHEALFVSCPLCKKKINFRTIGKHYKTHQSNHSMVDQFLCNLCGKILKSKRSFEDHQKVHKNVRDQLCDVCGNGFTTKKFLNLHKKTHEGSQRKVFGCPQCDKVFSGRHTLNRHLLTHSGEKNFICEICSKCFYTLQELKRHVRYHKKEYRFDCQLCDMRFFDKSRFRHHMMRHRNIRPYKCAFCDKMFIVRRKMNLHMAAKHNVQVQSTKGVWKNPKTYIPLDDLL